jgi:hypothetical protein
LTGAVSGDPGDVSTTIRACFDLGGGMFSTTWAWAADPIDAMTNIQTMNRLKLRIRKSSIADDSTVRQ